MHAYACTCIHESNQTTSVNLEHTQVCMYYIWNDMLVYYSIMDSCIFIFRKLLIFYHFIFDSAV